MRNRLLAAMLTGFAAASLVGVAVADAQPAPAKSSQCFYSHDWDGWKATPDSKSIYIRVGINKLWRMDLSSACPALQSPNAHLITEMHGSGLICSALDIDLRVRDTAGFSTPCIVSDLTPLTDAEAKALPKNLRP